MWCIPPKQDAAFVCAMEHFVGSERAGQRAAAIQTLLGTAQLNGLDPAAWLKDTLSKLPTWPNSRIDELLPLTPEFIEALKQEKL
ncbi:IS66 C-terminal element [Nitrosomonas marina]|uniref:IS66 C-terminal element n=1 Tax=Nitrosomonas marina TaxID=917 RepID=A0A1I0C7Z6_9PROT|nr:IS66 C-terminal element [Nitrosomonas marina]